MVHPEELAALDLLIWLGTGQGAAGRLHCNQSTISRRVRHCQKVFALELSRRRGDWQLLGSEPLLGRERVVHQQYRLLQRDGLRLEACNWPGRLLALPLPTGWVQGSFDRLTPSRTLQLLRERVIDAWLFSVGDELAAQADLVRHEICRLPTWLLADPGHPLAGERRLSAADLERFPTLRFADGRFPRFERQLRERGLWGTPTRALHYAAQDWEGRTVDQVTLCPGNRMGMLLQPQGPVILDWELGMESSPVLVVLPDLADHPAIVELLALLRQRWQGLRRRHGDPPGFS